MVGVKLAITVDMHAGTLVEPPQFGAPGFTGLEKFCIAASRVIGAVGESGSAAGGVVSRRAVQKIVIEKIGGVGLHDGKRVGGL